MSTIGLALQSDILNLVRGRDFKWTFANLDENNEPTPYPAGDLFFELPTGNQHNALQEVHVSAASGGTYAFTWDGETTTPIDYYDVTENPHGLNGDIQDALEDLPNVGAGNIDVHPAQLYPAWELTLTLNAGHVLSEQVVNVLNKSINDFYNTFDSLVGVDVDFVIHDSLNCTFKVTSLKSYDESGLITFAVDVIGTTLKNFLNAIVGMIGIFNAVHVDFYWNHVYQVEFTGELGLKPQPALEPDITHLTGLNGEQDVTVQVLKPGKARLTLWHFEIDGAYANIKIESEQADLIGNRTPWQLVWIAEGEPAGGDPVGFGRVNVQAAL